MGRNDKKTEPMNPMKTNRENPEIDAKKGAKAYLIEQPTEAENPRKETTERRLRPTRNQATNHHPCSPERPQQTVRRSLSGRENMRSSREK